MSRVDKCSVCNSIVSVLTVFTLVDSLECVPRVDQQNVNRDVDITRLCRICNVLYCIMWSYTEGRLDRYHIHVGIPREFQNPHLTLAE